MTFKQWLTKHERARFLVLVYSEQLKAYMGCTNSYTLYKHYYVEKEDTQFIDNRKFYVVYLKKDLS